MAVLVEPVRVSPFIKFCRWSLLITGIMYGASRHQSLSKRYNAYKAEVERTRPEREAKEKMERERSVQEELKMLSELAGSKI